MVMRMEELRSVVNISSYGKISIHLKEQIEKMVLPVIALQNLQIHALKL